MLKRGYFCKFPIIAVAVAQPVKQGNSHQLCFSLRQRPGRGTEDVGPGGDASAIPSCSRT